MISFVHEDRLGNMMEGNSHLFPVEIITDYDQYLDMKPPERIIDTKAESDEEKMENSIPPNRKS
jgi:hypothetical protein